VSWLLPVRARFLLPSPVLLSLPWLRVCAWVIRWRSVVAWVLMLSCWVLRPLVRFGASRLLVLVALVLALCRRSRSCRRCQVARCRGLPAVRLPFLCPLVLPLALVPWLLRLRLCLCSFRRRRRVARCLPLGSLCRGACLSWRLCVGSARRCCLLLVRVLGLPVRFLRVGVGLPPRPFLSSRFSDFLAPLFAGLFVTHSPRAKEKRAGGYAAPPFSFTKHHQNMLRYY